MKLIWEGFNMKIKKLIKALYFSNPELFGFNARYPYSVTEIYTEVIQWVELDNCKRIALNDSTKVYVDAYIKDIKECVIDWNNATRKEYIISE